jgi:hypothetical protein
MGCRCLTAVALTLALAAISLGGLARGDDVDEAVAEACETTVNQMKHIGLAVMNHHDVVKKFPSRAIMSKDGKPLLSWRVKILPYLGQGKLYEQFHRDEAWDSPHNKKLISKMPKVYFCPGSNEGPRFRTVYQVPFGQATAYDGPDGITIGSITDGTSKTIGLVETDDEHAVIWTKPDDWKFDPDKPSAGLGGHFPLTFYAGAFDASVHVLPDSIDAGTLRALFTIRGTERAPWPDN